MFEMQRKKEIGGKMSEFDIIEIEKKIGAKIKSVRILRNSRLLFSTKSLNDE